jgi:hypothetical protein
MAMRPEPLEIVCDAPPYAIVRACRMIDVERPEDVRWCEVTSLLHEHGLAGHLPDGFTWNEYMESLGSPAWECHCGRLLPYLIEYRFTYNTGAEARYSLAQCGRCKTVYWKGPEC